MCGIWKLHMKGILLIHTNDVKEEHRLILAGKKYAWQAKKVFFLVYVSVHKHAGIRLCVSTLHTIL